MSPAADIDRISDAQYHVTILRLTHWIHHELWTPQWWLLAATLIVPWIVWGWVVDRTRIVQILLYGVLMAYVVTVLDGTGASLRWWAYVYQFSPLYNRFLCVDVSALPVIYMLTYQYFTRWKLYIVMHVFVAAICAFVLEPLVVRLGIYIIYKWKYIYSFPIYILLAVLMKWFVDTIVSRNKPALSDRD